MVLQNTVVDLSHHNEVASFHELAAAGVRGVIHKATQGVGFTDSEYAARKVRALSVNLLWGAYHFANSTAPGAEQAAHFLKVVGVDSDTLYVLDWEKDPQTGDTLRVSEAERFVAALKDATGRLPVLYAGFAFLTTIAHAVEAGSLLAQSPLWIARYGPMPRSPQPWGPFALWQYTDGVFGGAGPHAVAGVGNCDRDFYNADLGPLEDFWKGVGAR